MYTGAAFSLAYDPDHPRLAGRLRDRLLHGAGFALVTGVPVEEGTTADAQRPAESMPSPLGEPFPQGRDTDQTLGRLVQDEGVSAYTDDRRFHETAYTSKSRGHLQLHNDPCRDAVRPRTGLHRAAGPSQGPAGRST